MGLAAIKNGIPSGALVTSGRGSLATIRDDLRRRKEILQLEQDVSVDQQGTVFERATRAVLGNPFIRNVLDVVSRPNYAIAGAFEEIASFRGWMSAGRSGEVFEEMGFGAGGSLASLAPFAFSETGEGAKLQRGGFFDWTARGAFGLALDIVFDPTTYLTFGAGSVAKQSVKAGSHFLTKSGVRSLRSAFDDGLRKGLTQIEADKAARSFVAQQIDNGAKGLADQGGIKLFGKTLMPGEVFAAPARSVSDGVTKFLHKSSLGEKVLEIGEGIGNVLDRDFRVRKIPEYVSRKQLYLTSMDNAIREFRDMAEDLYRGTNRSQREAISNYRDSGGKTAIDPLLLPLVKTTDDIYAQMAALEQNLGLLKNVRSDYVLHTYKEHPRLVDEILNARFDKTRLRATLKGSQKPRPIPTFEEARELGLTPVEDSLELLIRRGMRHQHAVHTKEFFDDVAGRWGIRALDDELENAAKVSSEMSDIAKLDEAEQAAVGKASRAGVPIDEVRKLSEGGQKEFIRRRFERVESASELENTMRKYKEFEDFFPETTNRATRQLKSNSGERMTTIPDLPEFKGVTVPTDIARDIVDFNKHFINREEVQGLLWAYDKFMNSFKVGVTAIFPAFHFRNAYSNVVQQFTDLGISAMNPAIHADSIRMLAGDVNGSFVARHGRRWGYGEVVYEAKRRGVMADYRNIFETFGDKIPIRTSGSSGKSAIGKLFGNPKDFIRHPIDRWKQMGGVVENEGRLAAFTNYLRRGLDPETAAQRVNKVLFDYKNLSKVERDVLARMFPFYRWTRKNIALQAERLARNPGQAATQAKLTRQNRTDPALLPKYLQGDMVFTLGTAPDGKINYIRGLDLPITDLNVIGEPLQKLISDLAPLPKIVLEVGTDRDFFRRRKISEVSTPLIKGLGPILDLLPKRAKDRIDFSKRTARDGTIEYRMNPTLTYVLIKSWAISRLYGTGERVMRRKSFVSTENFLDLGTGMRLQDVDVDVQMGRLENEYRKYLESQAVARGIRRRFTKTFVPKKK
jgi:hypothetical protein